MRELTSNSYLATSEQWRLKNKKARQLIDQQLETIVDEGQVAGMSLSIKVKGGDFYSNSFGYADIDKGKELAWDSIYRLISMSKPLTAVVALQLFEKGLIDLNDPVSKYLAGSEKQKVLMRKDDGTLVYEKVESPARIHNLLTHTAGYTYGYSPITSDKDVDPLYEEANLFGGTMDDFVYRLNQLPLRFQPNTTWHYGVAFDVLGYIIEKVVDMPLNEYFRKNLFAPLEMHDTDFILTGQQRERLVENYGYSLNGKLVPENAEVIYKNALPPNLGTEAMKMFSGGAGLFSTSGDIDNFCSMLVNKGEFKGRRILHRKMVDLMSSNHLKADALKGFPVWGYGFGTGVAVLDNVAHTSSYLGSVGEYGWMGKSNTYMFIDPLESMTTVVMSQAPLNYMMYLFQLRPAIYRALMM